MNGVLPNQIYPGITSTVTITGSGFYPGLSLKIGSYSLPSVEYLSASASRVNLPPTLPIGKYTLIVTNADTQMGQFANAIQVVGRYVYLPLILRNR